MYGGILGLIVGAFVIGFSDDISWWWEFGWFFGGMALEFVVRCGGGADVADALCSCLDLASVLSNLPDVGDVDCGGD